MLLHKLYVLRQKTKLHVQCQKGMSKWSPIITLQVVFITLTSIQSLSTKMTAQPSVTSMQLPTHSSLSFFAMHLAPVTSPIQIDEFHLPSFWNAQFPNFVFEKEIAVTDSSLVWMGTAKNSCERIALKITNKFQTESSEKIHQNKQNQFVMQHQLGCMVQVKQVVSNEQYRLMAMKYYPWDLQQILTLFTSNKNRKYSQQHISFIVYVFRFILTAVQELHSHGYVHRDLKPDNILFDEEFNLILSDFGLVTKQFEVDISSSGTLEYLAPQRLSKKRRQNAIKRSVDVWSLGVILYELFTGQNPFNGESEQQILQQICQGYVRTKQIPAQGMDLINRILEVNSEKRLSVDEIKGHLFLGGEVSRQAFQEIVRKHM